MTRRTRQPGFRLRRFGVHVLVVLLAAALVAPVCRPPVAVAQEDDEAPEPRQVQASIDGALEWLADHQITEGPDAGSWDTPSYRSATASFAGLAFLASGHLPGKGEYGAVVDRAMAFVQAQMTPDGYLGGPYKSGMYVHAIATLFGVSYLGMSENPEKEKELAEWCRKAIKVIVEAQDVPKRSWEQGGWRYTPYISESDLSVTSWQLLVLHAARQCGFRIDQAVIDAAMRYVNSAYVEASPEETGFVYRPGVLRTPEPAVTGVAVFLKSLLEEEPDEKVEKSLAYLRGFPPSWGGQQYKGYFFFGAFYMAQGMFQVGGDVWEGYAPKIQRILIEHQQGDGRWEFPPDNKYQSRQAGVPYATAMGALILSLEKQYLPMYQRQKQLF